MNPEDKLKALVPFHPARRPVQLLTTTEVLPSAHRLLGEAYVQARSTLPWVILLLFSSHIEINC